MLGHSRGTVRRTVSIRQWRARVAGTAVTTVAACVALVVPASSTAIAASAGTATSAPSNQAATVEQALKAARGSGMPVPATAATTVTDEVIANPNGTVTLRRSMVPVRKHTPAGWVNLDATLHRGSDGRVTTAATTGEVSFSGGGTGPLATMSSGGHTISFTAPVTLPTPVLDTNTATYQQIFPGVDLRARANKQGGFSYVLVIADAASAADPAVKQFALTAASSSGVRLTADASGNLTGKDKAGRTVLTAPAPQAWDSAGDGATSMGDAKLSTVDGPSAKAHRAALPTAVAGERLTVTVPDTLLHTAGLAYPLFVDPAFDWTHDPGTYNGWATVPEANRNSNYWNNSPDPDDNLQVGRNSSWWAHSFINFTLPISKLAGAEINSATLTMSELYSSSCSTRVVNVYAPATDLTSGNATWAFWETQNLGGVIASADVAHGYNSSCPAAAVAFDVKSTIIADVTAGNTLRTFGFTAANESTDLFGYKEFSEGGTDAPKLEITYNHTPNAPSGMTTSPATACQANPATAVGDGPVTLFAPVSDADSNQLGVEFTVWKTSDATQTPIRASDPNTLTYLSGTSALFMVDQAALRAAASGAITSFSWKVRTTDGRAISAWSVTCAFRFDPTRPGAPLATPPAPDATTIGTPFALTVTKPTGGTTPTSYMYQLNAAAPGIVNADAGGNATLTITPTRRTNTLTISSRSAAGNLSQDSANIIFLSAAGPVAADSDLNGDNQPDLLTIGAQNGLPAGLWQARGSTTGSSRILANGVNIGMYGNGTTTPGGPADYSGGTVVTGHFTGAGTQDTLVYYPSGAKVGTGVIITGSGDGSPLQPQYSDNRYLIASGTLADIDENYNPTNNPKQLVNAGDLTANGDPYPDLLAINGDGINGYHLSYLLSVGAAAFDFPRILTTATPTGAAWDQWKITTVQTGAGTQMFLWHPTSGALYLWRNLGLDPTTLTLSYQQTQIRASGWNTGAAITLRSADINADSTPDLWAVSAGPASAVVTAHLVSISGTPSIIAQPSQVLKTSSHEWPLADIPSGTTAGALLASSKDIVGTLNLSGAGNAKWNTGDTFSPDALLDGTNSTLATATPALSINADFSVSAWVKPAAPGGTVLSQDGTNVAGFRLYADTNASWRFAMSQTNTTGTLWDEAYTASNAVQTGVWTQLTATYNATSGMMNLAVNGVTVATATHTTPWNATGPFRAGATKTGGTNDSFFNGQLANLQTWTEVLDLTGASRTLMGDARADIIRRTNGLLMGYFNGGITAGNTVNWDSAPGGYTIGSGFTEADSAIRFADLNGDGFRDLIRHTPAPGNELQAKYNPGVPFNSSATWIGSSPWSVIGVGWNIPDSSIYFADLNGDHRDDIVKKVSGTLKAFYNLSVNPNGTMNWDQGSADGYEIGWGWTMPDSSLYFTDLTGDHYADIISKHADGVLGAYYNNGLTPQKGIYWDYNFSTGGYEVGWGWTMPDDAVYFGDLNGDGYADVMHKVYGYLSAYYNGHLNGDKSIAWYGNVAITPDWSAYPNTSIFVG